MALIALTPIRHDGVDYPEGTPLPCDPTGPDAQRLLDLGAAEVVPEPPPSPRKGG